MQGKNEINEKIAEFMGDDGKTKKPHNIRYETKTEPVTGAQTSYQIFDLKDVDIEFSDSLDAMVPVREKLIRDGMAIGNYHTVIDGATRGVTYYPYVEYIGKSPELMLDIPCNTPQEAVSIALYKCIKNDKES